MHNQFNCSELERIKELQNDISEIITNDKLEVNAIDKLLNQFPTRKTSKLLKANSMKVTLLKRTIKNLYVKGQIDNPEFLKSIYLLKYVTQVEEQRLNYVKFLDDIKKKHQEESKQILEQEKEQTKLKKQIDQAIYKKQSENYKKTVNLFLSRYKADFENFLGRTNRKVSMVTEDGQLSWGNLYIEIAKFITTLASKNGRNIGNYYFGFYKRTGNYEAFVEPYSSIARYLEEEFRKQFDPNKNTYTNLDDYSGIDFEGFVAQRLKTVGITDIRSTPVIGDQGADLIFRIGARRIAAQVKRHNKPVGNRAVQEIVGALRYYSVDEGWVITNTTFTPSAIELAKKNDISLIDGQILDNLGAYIKNLISAPEGQDTQFS